MGKNKVIKGKCHICGEVGELTYEHLPTKAAFNSDPVMRGNTKRIICRWPNGFNDADIQQQGAGENTLCRKCNSNTGGWYGNQYIDWCRKGMQILARAGYAPPLIYLYYLYPLPIIKQVISMFCSIECDDFTDRNPELRAFVLYKNKKNLHPKYRFFSYFNTEGLCRYIGNATRIDFESGQIIKLCEMSFPPFGYVMTIDSPPPDNRLFEITHFSKYGYHELVDMKLKLPVLPTHTFLPGDYRSKKEIVEVK